MGWAINQHRLELHCWCHLWIMQLTRNQINFQHCPFENHSESPHPFVEVLFSISCKKQNFIIIPDKELWFAVHKHYLLTEWGDLVLHLNATSRNINGTGKVKALICKLAELSVMYFAGINNRENKKRLNSRNIIHLIIGCGKWPVLRAPE